MISCFAYYSRLRKERRSRDAPALAFILLVLHIYIETCFIGSPSKFILKMYFNKAYKKINQNPSR